MNEHSNQLLQKDYMFTLESWEIHAGLLNASKFIDKRLEEKDELSELDYNVLVRLVKNAKLPLCYFQDEDGSWCVALDERGIGKTADELFVFEDGLADRNQCIIWIEDHISHYHRNYCIYEEAA